MNEAKRSELSGAHGSAGSVDWRAHASSLESVSRICAKLERRLVERMALLDTLDERERLFIGMISDGMETAECARSLGVRPMSAGKMRNRINRKLGIVAADALHGLWSIRHQIRRMIDL